MTAPRDWITAARTAALLDRQLDSIDWGDWPYEDDTRRAVAQTAQALAAIAEMATQDAERRNRELAGQVAELRAEKRADRHREEAIELAELMGGAL